MISFAVTAKLICVFVFAYAKSRFSHDDVLILVDESKNTFLLIRFAKNFSFPQKKKKRKVIYDYKSEYNFYGCKNDNFHLKNYDNFFLTKHRL